MHRFARKMTRRRLSLGTIAAVYYALFLSCMSQHVTASKTSVRRDPLRRSFRIKSFVHNEGGTCCTSADAQSRQACRFMNPRHLLINAPRARPEEFGRPCLAYERNYEPLVRPTFSVLLSSFNAVTRLPAVIAQLLKLTRGDWELLFLCDACTDNSIHVVRSLLEQSQGSSGSRSGISGSGSSGSESSGSGSESSGSGSNNSSWPPCPYGEEDIDQAAVWQTGVNLTSYQGDIGRKCHLAQKGRLVRAAMIDVQGAELFETAANNVLMLTARAPFLIL